MMERRLWLSGQAEKEWTALKPKPKSTRAPNPNVLPSATTNRLFGV